MTKLVLAFASLTLSLAVSPAAAQVAKDGDKLEQPSGKAPAVPVIKLKPADIGKSPISNPGEEVEWRPPVIPPLADGGDSSVAPDTNTSGGKSPVNPGGNVEWRPPVIPPLADGGNSAISPDTDTSGKKPPVTPGDNVSWRPPVIPPLADGGDSSIAPDTDTSGGKSPVTPGGTLIRKQPAVPPKLPET